jgi:hypothetical protein
MVEEIYLVRPDGGETLLSSSFDPGDLGALWEWCCYTKPIGPNVRVAYRQDSQVGCRVTTTGTESESLRAELAEPQPTFEDESVKAVALTQR